MSDRAFVDALIRGSCCFGWPARNAPAAAGALNEPLRRAERPQLESSDALKRRVEEASRFIDVDQLCISPQCGFASGEEGNLLTEDDQFAKLKLAVDTAHDIWGEL